MFLGIFQHNLSKVVGPIPFTKRIVSLTLGERDALNPILALGGEGHRVQAQHWTYLTWRTFKQLWPNFLTMINFLVVWLEVSIEHFWPYFWDLMRFSLFLLRVSCKNFIPFYYYHYLSLFQNKCQDFLTFWRKFEIQVDSSNMPGFFNFIVIFAWCYVITYTRLSREVSCIHVCLAHHTNFVILMETAIVGRLQQTFPNNCLDCEQSLYVLP